MKSKDVKMSKTSKALLLLTVVNVAAATYNTYAALQSAKSLMESLVKDNSEEEECE